MGAAKDKWVKIDISTPVELFDAIVNFVMEIGAQGVSEEFAEPSDAGDFPAASSLSSFQAHLPVDVRLEGRISSLKNYTACLAEIFPQLSPIRFTLEPLEEADWTEGWKKYFKPLRVTKNIIIKPTWERYTPVGHDVVIEVDPGMAFGTGQHPSTRMCLEAMEDLILKERVDAAWRVLDVGTGTGILGIAAAKLGASCVMCVEIDKQAADIALENVQINAVEDRVKIVKGDVAAIHDTFNLIVANLTAQGLIRLRPQFLKLLERGGFLVISGIIDVNREDIEAHFLAEPLAIHRTISEKEWYCYVLKSAGFSR